MQVLRNAILIALAFDATEDEVNAAHELIDRVVGGSVDPAMLIHAQVNGATGAMETGGTGQPANFQSTPTTSATPQLDSTGLPWDERIHSSNKKLNGKGQWWAARGVSPATKAKVESELRATLGSTATTTPAPAVATPQQSATPVAQPPMPGSNMPPMPGAAQTDPAYTALVQFIAANTQSTANPAGKFNDQYIKDILKHYGVADGSLQNLAHRLDLVPTVQGWLSSVVNGTAG